MALSKSDSSALIIALTDAIQNGSVNEHSSISLPKDWHKSALQALDETALKKLRKSLDDGGLEKFVSYELKLKLVESGVVPTESQKLTELACFASPLDVARELVTIVDTLPRQYRLIVRACDELADRVKRDNVDIKISSQLSLISGAMIPDEFSLTHENDDVDDLIRRDIFEKGKGFASHDTGLYFSYRTSGCISNSSSTKVVRLFLEQVRAFYGACLAFGIIDDYDWRGEDIQPIVAANLVTGEKSELCFLSRADDDVVTSANLSTSLETDRAIKNKKTPLEDLIAPVSAMFKADDNLRLSTAAIWILRANLSSKDMDRLLESTIAMEVLLGDRETSDRIGLSKLIANRCAYALGESAKDRKDIIDFFVEFYRVRSEIVHSGRFTLGSEDSATVNRGLSLAERMLKHEIELTIL